MTSHHASIAEDLAHRIEARLDHTDSFAEAVCAFLAGRVHCNDETYDLGWPSSIRWGLFNNIQTIVVILDELGPGWSWRVGGDGHARVWNDAAGRSASGQSREPGRALLAAVIRAVGSDTGADGRAGGGR